MPKSGMGRRQSGIVLAEQEHEKKDGLLGAEEVVAIVGGLLLDERMEREQLRRQTASNGEGETSRWRDASRRGYLDRLSK